MKFGTTTSWLFLWSTGNPGELEVLYMLCYTTKCVSFTTWNLMLPRGSCLGHLGKCKHCFIPLLFFKQNGNAHWFGAAMLYYHKFFLLLPQSDRDLDELEKNRNNTKQMKNTNKQKRKEKHRDNFLNRLNTPQFLQLLHIWIKQNQEQNIR